MIQFGMCYSGIIQAVWSTGKAKQKQGAFFKIMSDSLRKEILAPFGAGCDTTGTVGNQSLPLVLTFSILLHSSEIVFFFFFYGSLACTRSRLIQVQNPLKIYSDAISLRTRETVSIRRCSIENKNK